MPPTTGKAPKKPRNPLSKYRPTYAAQARKLCLLGTTDAELAGFFGVAKSTIRAWGKAHPAFATALKQGKSMADATVAERLYMRATGYEHPDTDIRVIGGEVVQTPITKYYPPDLSAAIFWLKNRQRGKWVEKLPEGAGGNQPSDEIIVTMNV